MSFCLGSNTSIEVNELLSVQRPCKIDWGKTRVRSELLVALIECKDETQYIIGSRQRRQ